MFDRLAVWLLSLPLILGGSAIAHWLSYRLVYPSSSTRAVVLADTGHGYLEHAPAAAAVAAAICVVALAVRVASRRWGGTRRGVPVGLLPFLALPPLAFAVQEHLERFVSSGSFPFDAALDKTFVVGLLMQIPFGIVVFLLARLLLEVADVVASARPLPPPTSGPAEAQSGLRLSFVLPARAPVIAFQRTGRGPPRPAASAFRLAPLPSPQ